MSPGSDSAFWVEAQRRIEECVGARLSKALEIERSAREAMKLELEQQIAASMEAFHRPVGSGSGRGALTVPVGPASVSSSVSTAAVREELAVAAEELRTQLGNAMAEANRTVAQGLVSELNSLAMSMGEQMEELRTYVQCNAARPRPPGEAACLNGGETDLGKFGELSRNASLEREVRLSDSHSARSFEEASGQDLRTDLVALRGEVQEIRVQVRRVLEEVGSVMELNSQLTGQLAQEQLQQSSFRARLDDVVAETTSLATAASEVASVVAWLAAQQANPSSGDIGPCPSIRFATNGGRCG